LGGEVVVGYTLIGEFVPPERRGRWSNALFVCTNISLPITTFIAIFVMRLDGNMGWRMMFLICSIPALLAYFIRKGIPESPRWYEAVGQKEKAAVLLDKIEAEIIEETGKELPPIKPTPEIISKILPFSALFSSKMFKRTIFAVLLNVMTMLIVYGYTTWLPTYFVSTGRALTTSMFYTTITMCGGPVGGIIGVLISDKISRKKAIGFVSIASAIIGYFYATATSDAVGLALGFLMVTSIYFVVALAWTCYIPEQFPTALRARGNGLASGTGRLANAAMPYLVVAMMANEGGFTYVLFMISGMAALCGVLTLLLGIETTGKSLETINEAALQDKD